MCGLVSAVYRLTPLLPTDLPQLVALEKRIFFDPWHPQAFVDLLNNEHVTSFALRDNRGLVQGYAAYYFIVDEAHVATIAVPPALRGQGLGERLLRAMLGHAYAQGGILATLEVRESNTVAQKLYQKYGFELVGERRRYYPNGETALLMTVSPLKELNFPEMQEFLS
jgi:ribosomal-protein-alanine N-acetyltransferase